MKYAWIDVYRDRYCVARMCRQLEVSRTGYYPDLAYDTLAIAQLYRDRGDAENAFDELKNQWGWGGFTTHDLKRCRFTAMTVALAYNWWSLFVRLAHPQARLEAITSRPFLLSAIGRMTSHAGKTHLSITPMHAKATYARALLTAVSQRLKAGKDLRSSCPSYRCGSASASSSPLT